jgi:toxin-antitoxin system PIN domain toxin
VLVYAFREDAPDPAADRQWLEGAIAAESTFGLADLVLSGFLRLITHPRIFDPPTPIALALQFAEALRAQPTSLVVAPGPPHWAFFVDVCRRTPARGNLIPDAYLAALAIESGSEFISTDRDYARFAGLRWRPRSRPPPRLLGPAEARRPTPHGSAAGSTRYHGLDGPGTPRRSAAAPRPGGRAALAGAPAPPGVARSGRGRRGSR